MMFNEDDFDLEDLETRLYSQVYHLNSEDVSPEYTHANYLPPLMQNMHSRYFNDNSRGSENRPPYFFNFDSNYSENNRSDFYQQQSVPYRGKDFPNNRTIYRQNVNHNDFIRFQNQPIEPNYYGQQNQSTEPAYYAQRNQPVESNYYGQVRHYEQPPILVNPVNNIVYLPPPITQIITTPPGNKRKKRKRSKSYYQRKQNRRKGKNIMAPADTNTDNKDTTQCNNQNRHKSRHITLHFDTNSDKTEAAQSNVQNRRRSRRLILQFETNNDNSKATQSNDHQNSPPQIQSSQEDDEVEFIPYIAPVIYISDEECKKNERHSDDKGEKDVTIVSSDEEKKVKSHSTFGRALIKFDADVKSKIDQTISHNQLEVVGDDEVIFIEPEIKIPEIINLDLDNENSNPTSINSQIPRDNDDNLSKTSHSTKSSTGATFSPRIKNKKNTAQDHRELLNTPDSTLNDFIESDVNLQRKQCNLYENDFDASFRHEGGNNSKDHDTFETASSSGTSESSVFKTALFDEVDFESPSKELFKDSDLHSFGNFIIPKRNIDANYGQAKTATNSPKSNCVKRKLADDESTSDSSSESDYEDYGTITNTSNSQKVKKNCLADLSTISSDNDSELGKKSSGSDCKDYGTTTISTCNLKKLNKIFLPDLSPISSDNDSELGKNKSIPGQSKSKIKLFDTRRNVNSAEQFIPTKAAAKQSSIVIASDNLIPEQSVTSIAADTFIISDDSLVEEILDLSNVGEDLKLANIAHSKPQESVQELCDKTLKKVSFNDVWTDDMERFYNDSWGGENYNVKEVQKTMSDDPNLWKINDQDRLYGKLYYPKGIKCHRCREVGHLAVKCPNKIGPVKCALCGDVGHLEPRCPNKICTSCGRHSLYFTNSCSACAHFRYHECEVCHARGHSADVCPDLWRRYYLTTKSGPLVNADNQFKSSKDMWCMVCAQKGHYDYNCPRKCGSHFVSKSWISSYADIYKPSTKDFDLRQKIHDYHNIQPSTSQREVSPHKSNNITDPLNSSKTDFTSDSFRNMYAFDVSKNSQHSNNDLSIHSATSSVVTLGEKDSLPHTPPKVVKIPLTIPNILYLRSSKGKVGLKRFLKRSGDKVKVHTELITSRTHRKGIYFGYAILTATTNSINKVAVIFKRYLKTNRCHADIHVKSHRVNSFLKKCLNEIKQVQIDPLKIYNKIKTMETEFLKITEDNITKYLLLKHIGEQYKLLNIFIYGKHEAEDGKKHRNSLQQWSDKINSTSYDLSEMSRSSIRTSFDYIFHEGPKVTNYEPLIKRIEY